MGWENLQKIALGGTATFYYTPVWSPDSKKIAYTDKKLNVWYVDVEKKSPTKVDTDMYDGPRRVRELSWSPDSRWVAYTKQLQNHLRAVFVYSIETGSKHQLTDGMSDVSFPVFDRDGKHLYFTASTDFGLTVGWRDMSSIARPVTRSVYVVVLRKDLPSPLEPESDEEKVADPAEKDKDKDKDKDTEKAKEKPPTKVEIDLDNIGQRILALPVPARNYSDLKPGKTGVIFLLESELVFLPGSGPGGRSVQKFDLKTRKVEKVMDGVGTFEVSQDGEKILFRQGERWVISGTAAPPKPGEGTLRVDALEAWVDPRAEWKQMFREAWRIQRDFFYDPGLHGLDLTAMANKYEPYVENIASRAGSNYLFAEMMGELTASHLNVFGGSGPEVKRVRGGLLGADYRIENGRYRFSHVFTGESWNPQLRAPLTQPGVNVVAGEYLLGC